VLYTLELLAIGGSIASFTMATGGHYITMLLANGVTCYRWIP